MSRRGRDEERLSRSEQQELERQQRLQRRQQARDAEEQKVLQVAQDTRARLATQERKSPDEKKQASERLAEAALEVLEPSGKDEKKKEETKAARRKRKLEGEQDPLELLRQELEKKKRKYASTEKEAERRKQALRIVGSDSGTCQICLQPFTTGTHLHQPTYLTLLEQGTEQSLEKAREMYLEHEASKVIPIAFPCGLHYMCQRCIVSAAVDAQNNEETVVACPIDRTSLAINDVHFVLSEAGKVLDVRLEIQLRAHALRCMELAPLVESRENLGLEIRNATRKLQEEEHKVQQRQSTEQKAELQALYEIKDEATKAALARDFPGAHFIIQDPGDVLYDAAWQPDAGVINDQTLGIVYWNRERIAKNPGSVPLFDYVHPGDFVTSKLERIWPTGPVFESTKIKRQDVVPGHPMWYFREPMGSDGNRPHTIQTITRVGEVFINDDRAPSSQMIFMKVVEEINAPDEWKTVTLDRSTYKIVPGTYYTTSATLFSEFKNISFVARFKGDDSFEVRTVPSVDTMVLLREAFPIPRIGRPFESEGSGKEEEKHTGEPSGYWTPVKGQVVWRRKRLRLGGHGNYTGSAEPDGRVWDITDVKWERYRNSPDLPFRWRIIVALEDRQGHKDIYTRELLTQPLVDCRELCPMPTLSDLAHLARRYRQFYEPRVTICNFGTSKFWVVEMNDYDKRDVLVADLADFRDDYENQEVLFTLVDHRVLPRIRLDIDTCFRFKHSDITDVTDLDDLDIDWFDQKTDAPFEIDRFRQFFEILDIGEPDDPDNKQVTFGALSKQEPILIGISRVQFDTFKHHVIPVPRDLAEKLTAKGTRVRRSLLSELEAAAGLLSAGAGSGSAPAQPQPELRMDVSAEAAGLAAESEGQRIHFEDEPQPELPASSAAAQEQKEREVKEQQQQQPLAVFSWEEAELPASEAVPRKPDPEVGMVFEFDQKQIDTSDILRFIHRYVVTYVNVTLFGGNPVINEIHYDLLVPSAATLGGNNPRMSPDDWRTKVVLKPQKAHGDVAVGDIFCLDIWKLAERGHFQIVRTVDATSTRTEPLRVYYSDLTDFRRRDTNAEIALLEFNWFESRAVMIDSPVPSQCSAAHPLSQQQQQEEQGDL